jgi:hypothetical protein
MLFLNKLSLKDSGDANSPDESIQATQAHSKCPQGFSFNGICQADSKVSVEEKCTRLEKN